MVSKYIHTTKQGTYKKILCVCSLGLLRSPTLALVLSSQGHNTRSCGSDTYNALIPITENLVAWADEIVFVNSENYEVASHLLDGKKVRILDIPDSYDYRDSALLKICEVAYGSSH